MIENAKIHKNIGSPIDLFLKKTKTHSLDSRDNPPGANVPKTPIGDVFSFGILSL